MVDVLRAEQLLTVLTEVIDQPLYDESTRIDLSATLSATSLEFARAVRELCASGQLLGASVCLRSQFESLVRSVWALHCASEDQVERLSIEELNAESAQSAKNIPVVTKMLDELQRLPNLANLMAAFNEFKGSAWQPLNSFVHGGLHAVIHTKFGWPPVLVDKTFRMSNGLCVLAFMHIGVLTGVPGIQRELIAAIATFSSVLPAYRVIG